MRHGKYPFIIGFLVVPLALYGLFVIWAYVQMFTLSFTSWTGFGAAKNNGFDNYKRLWHDNVFWAALRHNLFLLILLPVIAIAISLFFAFLLNVGGNSKGGVTRGVWGSKGYRIIFFFPQLLALVIVAGPGRGGSRGRARCRRCLALACAAGSARKCRPRSGFQPR